ncbi:MAG: HlyD family efflux transporter periplasmic adaptor subunit [Candidatus Staskawiczbacteria bacterium]|nr:HlyD family efflux transporter periplasmic adaptor subunit [Candidatus Staskawiczbacteria bacterium]
MSLRNLLKKIKALALGHKVVSGVIIIILIAVGYYGYSSLNNKSGETRYVLAAAEKGTIISSVSGSGQVSALNQLDIKAGASGKIFYINLQKGQAVKAGTLLAEVYPKDAQKTVQSAENDLVNAQLSTTDVQGIATDALDTAYDEGLGALTNIFKDLVTIKTNLDPMFQTSSYGDTKSDMDYYLYLVKFYNKNSSDLNYWNNDIEKKYTDMQDGLLTIQQAGWLLNKSSPGSQIEEAVNNAYTSGKTFLDLVRQAFNLAQEYQNILSTKNLTPLIASATTTSQVTNLSSAISSLSTDITALSTAKTDITTKEQAVAKIGTDVQSQNLNIQQYENALADAKDNLAKYYIYAPIDGIISAADSTVKTGNTVSSGTVLGSIVTKQQILEISLSETDIPKIKLGDKVVVTFDAIDGLSISGKVTEVDTVGTVSQGVVSYNVKITF